MEGSEGGLIGDSIPTIAQLLADILICKPSHFSPLCIVVSVGGPEFCGSRPACSKADCKAAPLAAVSARLFPVIISASPFLMSFTVNYSFLCRF